MSAVGGEVAKDDTFGLIQVSPDAAVRVQIKAGDAVPPGAAVEGSKDAKELEKMLGSPPHAAAHAEHSKRQKKVAKAHEDGVVDHDLGVLQAKANED